MEEDSTRRKATLLSAGGNNAVVRLALEGEDCSGCRACSLKTLCKGRESGHMDLSVPIPEGWTGTYAPGDEVTVEYTRVNAALAAAAMFVPALAGLALGGWLGSGAGDAALIAGCALGFAAGVGTSWLIARRSDALKPRARLITESEGEKE